MKAHVRPATAADFALLYGEPPAHTISAEVVEIDGAVVAIGGISYAGSRPLLFSRLTDALRPHKRFILEAARHLAERARIAGAAAVADPKERCSAKLLQRLGLHKIGDCPDGEVFAWPLGGQCDGDRHWQTR